MDPRLQKALDISNFVSTFKNQKKVLREVLDQDCYYYYDGGTFFIDESFISFLSSLITNGLDTVYIKDKNDLPVAISNTNEFLLTAIEVHQNAHKKYLESYENLCKNRDMQEFFNE